MLSSHFQQLTMNVNSDYNLSMMPVLDSVQKKCSMFIQSP